MKLYLAHPLDERKWIREIELLIEKGTGIELVNPFYDTERTDVKDIDAGLVSRMSPDLDYNSIVNYDLSLIDNCQGVVAFLNNKRAVGTSCEMWYCMLKNKPVYVVSEDVIMHPWIRYIIEKSNGKGFESWEEFIEHFKYNGEAIKYMGQKGMGMSIPIRNLIKYDNTR